MAAANAAGIRTKGDSITDPDVLAFGHQTKTLAGVLVSQTWPVRAQADIHTMAIDAGKVSADIDSQDLSGMYTDVAALSADVNVVRAVLGLPPTK